MQNAHFKLCVFLIPNKLKLDQLVQNITLTAQKCNSLIFIDSAVDDYHSLIAGVKPQTDVILLDPAKDGVVQITTALAGRTEIKSVHIVSHGSAGAIKLGNTELSLETLDQYRSQLQQWREVLTADANILLYGCYVAAKERGVVYLERLKSLIGAEIAASTNLTGNSTKGGNWDLEVTTGFALPTLAFESKTMESYASVLATFIDEDFSNANSAEPPTGWTNVVIEGNPETDQWRFDNPGDRTFGEPLEDPIAVYDSDALSDDNQAENAALVSPVFDTSDVSEVYLEFDQDYRGIAAGENASEAFVEVYDGTAWQSVYSTVDDAENTTRLDISEQAAGVENAQVRFRFDGNWSFLWAVDNVSVVDELTPGVTVPTGNVGVSEDNVPDPLDFQFALESRPTAPVTLTFNVDETQLEPIEPITFTSENWNKSQVSEVMAVADDVAEGNDQTSPVSITVTSEDSDYNGLTIADIPVEITDDAIPGFTSYRTVEGTYRDLSQLASANPDLASWIDIGDSYDKITPGGSEGYDIYALKLTNENTNSDQPKPVLYVEGSIHAREYTTAELATRFAEDLIAGYGKNADISWLLDQYEINIVPVVNPDGRKFAEQGYSWRKNTNPNPPEGEEPAPFPTYGVDLNRNFDSKWGEIEGGSSGDPADLTYRGAAPFSEPETQVVRDYATSLFPDQRGEGDFEPAPSDATGVFIDLHSYGNLILYPFGWTDLPSGNKKELETLGRKFGYFSGLDGEAYEVDQAVGLYPTDGTADDWSYEALGVAGYTFELGTEFFQDTEYFEDTIVPEIIPALFYAAKSAYRPYQTPAGPESIEVSADLPQVTAGTSVFLFATADDTRYDDGIETERDTGPEPVQNIAQARYSIDQPSWEEGVEFFSLDAVDGAFNSSQERLQATIDTTDLAPGRHTIFVESQDANGNFGVPTAIFLDVIDLPNANVINGNDGNNTLIGSDDSDAIYARGGNDIAAGGMGDDLIVGGNGEDILRGDRNSNTPDGSEGGNDIIYGGGSNDRIGGKGGNDKLYGEAGDDYIWGDAGDDLLWGGFGNDILAGGGGDDTFVLSVGEGSDTISDFQFEDSFGLAGTLTFGQLSITQDGDNALVYFDDETLAILTGVEATTLDESIFTPVAMV